MHTAPKGPKNNVEDPHSGDAGGETAVAEHRAGWTGGAGLGRARRGGGRAHPVPARGLGGRPLMSGTGK